MKLLLKKMSKYWYLILLIIGILFVQAFTELKLPDYMAKIVNVGIQQNGIDVSLPKAISKDTFEKMKLVTKEEEFKKIEDLYKLESKENAKKIADDIYKDINVDSVYVLKDLSKLNDKNVELILAKSIMMKEFIEKGKPQGVQATVKNDEAMKFPSGEKGFMALKTMPKQSKEELFKKIDSTFGAIPESMLLQSSMKFISMEYEKMGINLSSIQSTFILHQGLSMMGVAFISLVASLIVGFIASKIAADFGRDLRDESFKKVLSFSNAEFDKFSTASLITRANNDIQQVQNMLVMMLRILFYAPILGVGGIIKALRTNAGMAWIIALAVLLIVAIVGIIFSFAIPLFKKIQKKVDKLQLVTREILNGLLVIRAFVTGKHEEERFREANLDITNTNQKIANIMISMQPLLMLLMNALLLVIVWVGAHEINKANLQEIGRAHV